jgi:hypothetical protein
MKLHREVKFGPIQLIDTTEVGRAYLKVLGLRREDSGRARLAIDDSRFDSLVELMKSHGAAVLPHLNRELKDELPTPAVYVTGFAPMIDQTDIDRADYLQLWSGDPALPYGKTFRDKESGQLIVGTPKVQKTFWKASIFYALPKFGANCFIIADQVKRDFESIGVRGLSCRRVGFLTAKGESTDDYPAWWELDCTTIFPRRPVGENAPPHGYSFVQPLSDEQVQRLLSESADAPRGWEHGWYVFSLAKVGSLLPFDLAGFESNWKVDDVIYRARHDFVVSKRVYEYLLSVGLKPGRVVPVRFE